MRRAALVDLLIGLAFILAGVAVALAHPGRLDRSGCHDVHRDFTYKSGVVVRAGERHCHRVLGETRLDGTERLDDDGDEPDASSQPMFEPAAVEAR